MRPCLGTFSPGSDPKAAVNTAPQVLGKLPLNVLANNEFGVAGLHGELHGLGRRGQRRGQAERRERKPAKRKSGHKWRDWED